MSLVFPGGGAVVGEQAGFHVLIAGVSDYPTAPPKYRLQPLTTPARTAYKIYQWFLRQHQHDALPVPLASVRLLLSPAEAETDDEPWLAEAAEACTYANFAREVTEWRADASKNKENVTFFYFAGHGIQRTSGDSVLLMHDFGEKPGDDLSRTASTQHIFYGMKPFDNKEQMAEAQLYFIDACRDQPDALLLEENKEPPGIFDINPRIMDNRKTLLQYAAVTGGRAYGLSGDQTLFGKALLESLACAADRKVNRGGRTVWAVSARSLFPTVEDYTKYLVKLYGEEERRGGWRSFKPAREEQYYAPATIQGDAHICYLSERPSVDLVLEIDPAVALDITQVDIPESSWELSKPLCPHPYEGKLPRGVYQVCGRIDPPDPQYKDYEGELEALLPRQSLKLQVLVR